MNTRTTLTRVPRIARTGAVFLYRKTRARVDRIGRAESEAAVVRESREYWRDSTQPRWKADSHWQDGIASEWPHVGAEHLNLLKRLTRGSREFIVGTTVEWGSGGGANAVHFAPLATEFISVDVSEQNLAECERQVRSVCGTPVHSVLIDVAEPEAAIETIGSATSDLFLCLYVIELVPSRAYAQRILGIAEQLLKDNGVAFFQFKYETADRWSRSARRSYKRNLSAMTVFPIDEFWEAAAAAGLQPQALHLVPRNALDERYGYLVCTRPGSTDALVASRPGR